MYKAKQEFLWYKSQEDIKDEDLSNCEQWERDGLVELVKPSLKKEVEVAKVLPKKKSAKKKR